MQFDDQSVDVSGVSDRRGMGGGGLAMGGGGLGIVGVILYFVVQALGGGGGGTAGTGLQVPSGVQAPAQGGGSGSTADLQQRCNSEGALERYTDCRLIKVYNVADTVWRAEFDRRGARYVKPTLVFFSSQVSTACGAASSEVGPFYCPGDQGIYLDLDFLDQLQRQYGAPGEFAQAYIMAHEYGHHLQRITGTEAKVRKAQQANPNQQNALSVAMELQADCYAGVWSRLADDSGENGIALSRQDVQEAINAAEAVGDDRIQSRTRGQVNPETWTHGSAQQRATWFQRGLTSGDVSTCNTFG